MKKYIILSIVTLMTISSLVAKASSDLGSSQQDDSQIITEGKVEAGQIDFQETNQIAFINSLNNRIDRLIDVAAQREGALQELNLGQMSATSIELLKAALQARRTGNTATIQSAYNDAIELQKAVVQAESILGK